MPEAIVECEFKLSNKQKECITFQAQGDLLVRGVAGSGKTTVLIERAKWLKERDPAAKIRLISFNSALARYIKHLACKSNPDTPMEVSTFHGWGKEILQGHGWLQGKQLASSQIVDDHISHAKNILCQNCGDSILPDVNVAIDKKIERHKAIVSFLKQEIAWIKNNGLDRDSYISCTRSGRGDVVRVLKKHRDPIYKVLEIYDRLLERANRIDFQDVALMLHPRIKKIDDRIRPDHILVDEAQDLSQMQLAVLAGLAGKSLTICADVGQKIYPTNFSWKNAGIEVTGRRTKPLLNTFRSTREIISLAKSFQERDADLKKQEGFIPPDLPETSGPLPLLARISNWPHAMTWIADQTRSILRSNPKDTIGLIARSETRLSELAEIMTRERIPFSSVRGEESDVDIFSPGAKLTTYHSAKGLEFDHVIITDLKKNWLPHSEEFLCRDGADLKEAMTRERMLFYVAMTRAKLSLSMVSIQPESSFVPDLDSKYYRSI